MKVYALVGESGCGKSYRAMIIAYKYKIKYIIDDGLLIGNGKILAGLSAKREKTALASVKRAIFMYDDSRENVKNAIKQLETDSILIIGTSVEMVDLIAKRLELDIIYKYIYIRDIATEEEIAFAKHMRNTQGKHVIPVPAFEVKKSFSGYFIDPLKVFFKLKEGAVVADKTIVRPTYSYLGDYILSKGAVSSICRHEIKKIKGVYCKEIRIDTLDNGIIIDVDIAVHIGVKMRDAAKLIQNTIKTALEDTAGLVVLRVNIKILSLTGL